MQAVRVLTRSLRVRRGGELLGQAPTGGRRSHMDLVIGATGYVGGRLVDRLLEEGRPVRALAPRRHEARRARRSGARHRATCSPARASPPPWMAARTAYYLVHSMEAGDEPLRRARSQGREAVRRRRHGGGHRARGLPGRAHSFRRASLAAPRFAPRGGGDPAGARPGGHRAASVDPDRRGLVVVPDAGPAGGAAAGAPDARVARQPDPAHRRDGRDRVPGPHARACPRPPGARST